MRCNIHCQAVLVKHLLSFGFDGQSNSARALVKKTQEPGIKLQKADFFRNDTWTSPQTNSEDAPKIPLVHFF